MSVFGTTPAGAQSGELIAGDVAPKNIPLLLAAPQLLEFARAYAAEVADQATGFCHRNLCPQSECSFCAPRLAAADLIRRIDGARPDLVMRGVQW